MQTQKQISYVVSPQNWGKLFISKHHYAIELSKLGHLVYFIEPPIETTFFSLPKIQIIDTEYPNLKVVKSKLFFSLYFKFHLAFIHHLLIRFHRKLLLFKLGSPLMVLSFDLVNNFPLKGLNCKRIFFAADEPRADMKLISAKGSDLIVSVSQHILDIYQYIYPNTKKLLVNHGVADEFLLDFSLEKKIYCGINIGLSGNFMFNDIDYPILMEIIKEHKDVNFHLFGPTTILESNIGAFIPDIYKCFYDLICQSDNVKIHGVLNKLDLAKELNQMDAFLICYHPEKGQSSGSNSHKILEYLSTGKVIVSNNFSHFHNNSLINMDISRQNANLKNIFSETLSNLNFHNNKDKLKMRKLFALNNSYSSILKKVLQS